VRDGVYEDVSDAGLEAKGEEPRLGRPAVPRMERCSLSAPVERERKKYNRNETAESQEVQAACRNGGDNRRSLDGGSRHQKNHPKPPLAAHQSTVHPRPCEVMLGTAQPAGVISGCWPAPDSSAVLNTRSSHGEAKLGNVDAGGTRLPS
jgi:hypothetical protein